MIQLWRSLPFLLFYILVSNCFIYGQNIPVSIKVLNREQHPVPYATVQLKDKSDSTNKIGTITDSIAVAILEVKASGFYQLDISAIGYKSYSKTVEIQDSNFHFSALLEMSSSALDEVVIQSFKPLMQQEDDKTIINTESLEAASTNAYEILEKTPGLFIDQDGNIYLNGTTPATVYINGKELKMSKQDVASMLKSLPPNSVEKIELLRTPSAKYDAASSGGIVNLILKKGVKIGLTGSVNTGIQQGTYGNKFAGLSLSNNNGTTSSYLNLNYGNNNNDQLLQTNRLLSKDTILAQSAYTTYPGDVMYMGYGLNRDIHEHWNISYDGRLNYSIANNNTNNTNIFEVLNPESILGTSNAISETHTRSYRINQDVATTYKIDSLGSEWKNSFSYAYNKNKEDLNYNTYSILPYGGHGTSDAYSHFFNFQSDLIYKLPYRISMETGLKTTYLSFNTTADYKLINDGITSVDQARTTDYQYRENINAAYIQASKGFGAYILKAGVRAENTNMSGQQFVPADTSFSLHRTDLFPYLYFSRKLMSIAKYELRAYLVYRRTISRPSYAQLNPFPRYVDQFVSEVGNPSLKPQFTNNFEANVSIDERPLFAVGYNDTKDMFTDVYYQGDSVKAQAYKTTDNIGRNKEFYLRGIGVIPPGGVYFFLVGAQYNHNLYNGRYQDAPFTFTGNSWLFFTYHQLKIDKNSMLTLNGFLRLKGNLQFYELSPFGSLSLNINRRFLKQKLTVTLSVNDAFFTNNNNFSINQPTVNAYGYRETDSRRVGLNIRYNFGIRKKEEEQDLFKMPQ